ncbi:hypothetical protein BDZ45DRAFT_693498 [Acephala macrosclerotiorum]|nr:hypothetical protein BDZ45DRAFT_693498 [Acephala macrosclerotiorum]
MVVVLECILISALWDTDVKGRCVNSQALGFAGAGAGMFEDFVLILLPISELRTLTLDWKKKVVLILMFALRSWEQVVIIWSGIKAYVAVIYACLITLRALLIKYFPGLFTVKRAREPRGDSTLPSWRVRHSSKLAVNLGKQGRI